MANDANEQGPYLTWQRVTLQNGAQLDICEIGPLVKAWHQETEAMLQAANTR